MSTVRELLQQALYEPSFWRSRAAARSLEQLHPPVEETVAPLAEALGHSDERVRRRAVRLLGTLSLPAATVVPHLRRALTDAAWAVRHAAVQGLADQGADVLSVLLPALTDEISGVREAAAEAVGTLAASSAPVPEEMSAALLACLSDPDESVRVAVLASAGYKPAATATALKDVSATVRCLALTALGRLGLEAQAFEPELLRLLGDPVAAVRRQAVVALGQAGTETAVGALLPLLQGELRDEAAQALGQLGRRLPRLEALLLEAFRRGDASGRVGALQALARLGSTEALAECRRLCREGALPARRRAVRALGWFGTRSAEVVPDLEAALRDSHGKVRRTAAEALAALGSHAAPALAGLLRRLYDREARVRSACAAAILTLLPQLPQPQQSWLGVLADAAHGPGHNLRRALARPDLPDPVRTAFRAACLRRAAWHTSHAGTLAPACATLASPWKAARAAALQAGFTSTRKCPDAEKRRVASAARVGEHAWQMACLWTLLFPVS